MTTVRPATAGARTTDLDQGMTEDAMDAIRRYRPAAEQGDAEAQYSLGYMYAWPSP